MSVPSDAAAQPSTRARVELQRADIGFSAAHFSVINGRAERLHGHNYQVSLRALGDVTPEGTVIDFGALKQALRAACAALDERVLIAELSRDLTVTVDAGDVVVVHGSRRYVFPSDDVRLLPIDNTTCERLAAMLLRTLRDTLGAAPVRLALTVEELPGQGASVEE